jgi:hypothetical protein
VERGNLVSSFEFQLHYEGTRKGAFFNDARAVWVGTDAAACPGLRSSLGLGIYNRRDSAQPERLAKLALALERGRNTKARDGSPGFA